VVRRISLSRVALNVDACGQARFRAAGCSAFQALPAHFARQVYRSGAQPSPQSDQLRAVLQICFAPRCCGRRPVTFSSAYSRTLVRTSAGRSGAANMRLMTFADRPLLLWLAWRMVQVVLRDKPSALLVSRGRYPKLVRANPISLILADCRALISPAS